MKQICVNRYMSTDMCQHKCVNRYARLQALTLVLLKAQVFVDRMLCYLVSSSQHFEGL
jgi:hypothetical protein